MSLAHLFINKMSWILIITVCAACLDMSGDPIFFFKMTDIPFLSLLMWSSVGLFLFPEVRIEEGKQLTDEEEILLLIF